MEIKTYFFSIGSVWLTVVVTEYIGHHMIFAKVWEKFNEYAPAGLFGSGSTFWNMLGILFYSVIFVQLYTLNFIGTGPTVGLQFGLLLGCLVSIPQLLHRSAHAPIRWELDIIPLFVSIAESGFAGILVGWLFQ